MLEIPRILCPIDFSVTSRQAWNHAMAIAGWYGSTLTALHVCHPGIATESQLRYSQFPVPFELTDKDRQQLSAQFQPWLQTASAAGLAAEMVLDAGQGAAGPILEHARALPASLIVMGTHGRGGIERLMLGSVTEKVLRKAECPVLTVPAPAAHAPAPPYKRIFARSISFPRRSPRCSWPSPWRRNRTRP